MRLPRLSVRLDASPVVHRTGTPLAEFKNPNQQGGGGTDTRSLFVMMFVMLAVFFGLSYYRQKKNPQTVSPNSPAVTQSAPQASTPPPTATATALPAPAGAQSTATPAVQAAAEQLTVVENELYRIEFTNRGAQVRAGSSSSTRTPTITP
jgi:YidC/Oxa1 family membrane protein insertase